MKNKIWFLLIIILAVIISVVIYFGIKSKDDSSNTNYDTSRTSTNNENTTNIENTNNESKNEDKTNSNNTDENKEQEASEPQYKEEQLSTFSTKIYSKDSERQNNINITCNTLNDTIVKNGETFSFCNTVGKATSSKGYEEADVFDHNGNKTKGLRRWKLPSKQYSLQCCFRSTFFKSNRKART